MMPTRVELWFEGGVPQVGIHTQGEDFQRVRTELGQLRDRLDREIADGPTRCPFAPRHPLRIAPEHRDDRAILFGGPTGKPRGAGW